MFISFDVTVSQGYLHSIFAQEFVCHSIMSKPYQAYHSGKKVFFVGALHTLG